MNYNYASTWRSDYDPQRLTTLKRSLRLKTKVDVVGQPLLSVFEAEAFETQVIRVGYGSRLGGGGSLHCVQRGLLMLTTVDLGEGQGSGLPSGWWVREAAERMLREKGIPFAKGGGNSHVTVAYFFFLRQYSVLYEVLGVFPRFKNSVSGFPLYSRKTSIL